MIHSQCQGLDNAEVSILGGDLILDLVVICVNIVEARRQGVLYITCHSLLFLCFCKSMMLLATYVGEGTRYEFY